MSKIVLSQEGYIIKADDNSSSKKESVVGEDIANVYIEKPNGEIVKVNTIENKASNFFLMKISKANQPPGRFIRIDEKTHDALTQIAHVDESYSEVINRLLMLPQ